MGSWIEFERSRLPEYEVDVAELDVGYESGWELVHLKLADGF